MIKDSIRQFFTDEYPYDSRLEKNTSNQQHNDEQQAVSPLPSDNITNQLSASQNIPDAFQELYQECLTCHACELCDSASNLVFGTGDPNATLMIIGEAPGADEDAQGIPFVGRAGQLLIKTLQKYGVEREQIYIANILKHRPPNNRNPLPTEIEACTPFLRKQLDIVRPKLLLTLGNFASQFILDTKTGITKIRGTIHESSFGIVMPTLHPSAIIRGAYPIQLFEGDIVRALQYIGYDITTTE